MPESQGVIEEYAEGNIVIEAKDDSPDLLDLFGSEVGS